MTGTSPADPGNPWPKHHQVYLVLRRQIRERQFPADVPLPNEILLAGNFKVSRITIRRAMERLEREGLVERHRGRGTFVRPGVIEPPIRASLSGSIEDLVAMGLETEVRVLSLDYVGAVPEIAGSLDIAPGATVQKAVRVRSHQGRPFSHLTTHVPEDLGRTFDADDLLTQPLLLLIERAGMHIARADQAITATLATPEIAAQLDMEAGDALLRIRRVVYAAGERPVEHIVGLYRPDTYEHQMHFDRRERAGTHVWSPVDAGRPPDGKG